MTNLADIATVAPFDVWGEAVRARQVTGERVAFALVELAPDAVVPEHRHPHEQLGMVITGSVVFRIDEETRALGPGGTWRIPSDHPHEVRAGADGAVVIDIFAPVRDDWDRFPRLEPRPPAWPGTGWRVRDARRALPRSLRRAAPPSAARRAGRPHGGR